MFLLMSKICEHIIVSNKNVLDVYVMPIFPYQPGVKVIKVFFKKVLQKGELVIV